MPPKKLLLVDDEPQILTALKRILRRENIQVDTATSGLEALELIRTTNYQVLITDFRMAGMNGRDLLVEAKQLQPNLYGIILSGYADTQSVISALNSGAVKKFLEKPWNDSELLAEVRDAFRESHSSPQRLIPEVLEHHELSAVIDCYFQDGDPASSLAYFDINQFHHFLDNFGYEEIRPILQQVAGKLTQNLPDFAELAFINGDEFAVFLPAVTDPAEVEALIKTILKPFDNLISYQEREIFISFNAGYAMLPQDGANGDDAIRNARQASVASKKCGMRVFPRYHDEGGHTANQVQMQSDLFKALEHEQLSVVYQPKVCLHTGNILGAEALIRWNHPSLGLISPAEFIPLAEGSGLIGPIGEWVLSTAALQTQMWRKDGLLSDFKLAVNLSGRQLQEDGLVQAIENVLQKSGMKARDLELEITETFLMHDIEHTIHLLQQLKALGIAIAIDDFGTGYSSLNYLSRLPVDTLKIDRSFTSSILENRDNYLLVKNIINISKNLGMETVAEGLETPAQLKTLQALNCDVAQGFFYSPPVTPKAFRALLNGKTERWDLPFLSRKGESQRTQQKSRYSSCSKCLEAALDIQAQSGQGNWDDIGNGKAQCGPCKQALHPQLFPQRLDVKSI